MGWAGLQFSVDAICAASVAGASGRGLLFCRSSSAGLAGRFRGCSLSRPNSIFQYRNAQSGYRPVRKCAATRSPFADGENGIRFSLSGMAAIFAICQSCSLGQGWVESLAVGSNLDIFADELIRRRESSEHGKFSCRWLRLEEKLD